MTIDGNDQWSGSLAIPNRQKSDGPFATVSHAIEASREFKQRDSSPARPPVTILIRRGSYFLNEPLVLKPEDSELTLASYPGEKPKIGRASCRERV